MLKTKILSILVLLLVFSTAFSRPAFAAGSASVTLVSSNNLPGAVFPVTIYEDSGSSPVQWVEVNLIYDKTQLELINTGDNNGTEFDVIAPLDTTEGNVKYLAGMTQSKRAVGSVKAITFNFKATEGVTSSLISIGGNTKVMQQDPAKQDPPTNIWDGVNNSGTYNFISAPKPSPALPPAAAPVKKTAPPSLDNQPKINSTKSALSPNFTVSSLESEPPRGSPLLNFLIASVLAAAAFVAMYFNAHEKVARHAVRISKKSARRFSRKRAAPQLEEHTHTT